MPERVVALAEVVARVAEEKIVGIQRINAQTRILALNALIEATRAGSAGIGFGVVAREVKAISKEIDELTDDLTRQLQPRLDELEALGRTLVASVRGTRLADLALNAIEIIDRNLYERSCDVRWWATDSAVVGACTDAASGAVALASKRLGIILESYTVYCDLVVCDLDGRVLAHGRPDKYPQLTTASMADRRWFKDALATRDGTAFAVADVATEPALGGQTVATYAAAVRENGETNGRPIGVLGVFFDWATQAQTVVNGVRLSEDESARSRVLIVDSHHHVLAASDGRGILKETLPLEIRNGTTMGHYQTAEGQVIGFARTPGYETYKGLGWYGVLVQSPPATAVATARAA